MIGARLQPAAFRAMGTECAAAVTIGRGSDRAGATRALTAAQLEVEACEQALSRFRPDSDLSRLNSAHGEWVAVDRRLIDALRSALRARDDTGGRYDPTILPALEAAGYDRSFEELRERAPATADGWRPNASVELDVAASRARVEPGAAVDLGGIGKGFAAERALQTMTGAWPALPGALVDLGGDIAVCGAPPDGGPWRLSIADPRGSAAELATVAVRAGAAATSGRDQRRFGPAGRLHHLIDPTTGSPAEQGPLAVTVAGTDAAQVEAYATALAISSLAEATALLDARPQLSALFVPREGEPVVIGDLPLLATSWLMEVIA